MHIPLTPPRFRETVEKIVEESPQRIADILTLGIGPEPNGKYYHWDKLRHLNTPSLELSHQEWWVGVKAARKSLYRTIPHTAKDGSPFVFGETNNMRRHLHEIDKHGGGELRSSTQVANVNTRDTYLINSLIEEAITSSQLEGAVTTRKVAKEMIRVKRSPRDRSERMIMNNYRAMEFINEYAAEELTPSIVLELHRILTIDTLDDESAVGRFRSNDEIYVGDERDATILHVPPKYEEISERVHSICDFANNQDDSNFTHPVIRAILLHFLLAYDHPFEDGNGRTARALFYWSMLKQGYWTMELVSISRILKKAPAQYMRSYLYTETDENDITYFILHQLEVIKRAIVELLEYLRRKADEQREVQGLIKESTKLQKELNHRQLAAVTRALKFPDAMFTIESHRGAHGVTYDTARTDLLKLLELGLLEQTKRGRAFVYLVPENLRDNLKRLDL